MAKNGQPPLDSLEAIQRQNEVNERIMSEIQLMSQEALEFLKKAFENDISLLLIQ